MRFQADVQCYHCGHISGTWEWPAAHSAAYGAFQQRGEPGFTAGALGQLHCLRCGGPVFLDEVARSGGQRPGALDWAPRRLRSRRSQPVAG